MDYQLDSRNHRSQEVRIGRNDQEIVVFRKVNFFIHNLQANVDGLDYQLKRAAPWNGFRYQLCQGQPILASATRHRRMHAFEPDRPLIRHNLVEFHLDVSGRALNLTPQDRHGLLYLIEEAGNQCGRLAMRPFESQTDGAWEADLSVPDDWSVAQAGFVAWLAREGRSRMVS
jgi:hypothetical protein